MNTGVKNLVQSLLKTLALALVMFTLFSCGNDSTTTSTSSDVRVIDAEITTLQLSFPSILKYSWAPWYADSLYRYMNEKTELDTLFTTEVNRSDLHLLRCDNFNLLPTFQKKRFWILYMASIAHAESGLNPNDTYREPTDGTLSSGLLQIDRASANRHSTPYTGFVFTQNDLFNPDLNLMAGLYILKHQLEGGISGERPDIRGRLFTNSSYYWSVLVYKREMIVKTFTQNARVNLPFCSIGG
ncbi:MAG: transglycosylase SLT domain-containing protein [Rhizobacter sp.]|nr:transglycosylase SLT domain-containing protein [Bacteriovorax sp.]